MTAAEDPDRLESLQALQYKADTQTFTDISEFVTRFRWRNQTSRVRRREGFGHEERVDDVHSEGSGHAAGSGENAPLDVGARLHQMYAECM